MKMYRPCLAFCIAYSLFVHGASAFGPLGHATVGAINESTTHSATAAKVKTILEMEHSARARRPDSGRH